LSRTTQRAEAKSNGKTALKKEGSVVGIKRGQSFSWMAA
jgi:hypothetical protein